MTKVELYAMLKHLIDMGANFDEGKNTQPRQESKEPSTPDAVARIIALVIAYINNYPPEKPTQNKSSDESKSERIDQIFKFLAEKFAGDPYPIKITPEAKEFLGNKVHFTIRIPELSNFIQFLVTKIYPNLDQNKVLEIIKFAIEESQDFQISGQEIKLSLIDKTLFGLLKNPAIWQVLKDLLLSKDTYRKDFKKTEYGSPEQIKMIEDFTSENGIYRIVVPDLIANLSKLLEITGDLDLAQNKDQILAVVGSMQKLIVEDRLDFVTKDGKLIIQVDEVVLRELTDLIKLDKKLILILASSERFGSTVIRQAIANPFILKIYSRLYKGAQKIGYNSLSQSFLKNLNSIGLAQLAPIIGIKYDILLWLISTARHLKMEKPLALLIKVIVEK